MGFQLCYVAESIAPIVFGSNYGVISSAVQGKPPRTVSLTFKIHQVRHSFSSSPEKLVGYVRLMHEDSELGYTGLALVFYEVMDIYSIRWFPSNSSL